MVELPACDCRDFLSVSGFAPDRLFSVLSPQARSAMPNVETDTRMLAFASILPRIAPNEPGGRAGCSTHAVTVSHKIVRDNDCLFAHFCARVPAVNGREFIKRVRRLARGNGIAVRFDRTRGKGSHGTLYYGDRFTVVKDRRKPLKAGTLRGMCKQLGIDPNDL